MNLSKILSEKTIRDGFKKYRLQISAIMTKGYRSQFRNAFAHSDYSFGLNEDEIILHNYKPNSYEVESIEIDKWTSFFCHSFLLNYHFEKYYYEERQKMDKQPIEVFLRNKNGEKEKGMIKYNKEKRGWSYV